MKKLLLITCFAAIAIAVMGATISIPGGCDNSIPGCDGAIRVQAAGTGTGTGTSTASAAPSLGLRAAWYRTPTVDNYIEGVATLGRWLDSSGNNCTAIANSLAQSPADSSTGVVFSPASKTVLVCAGVYRSANPTTIVACFNIQSSPPTQYEAIICEQTPQSREWNLNLYSDNYLYVRDEYSSAWGRSLSSLGTTRHVIAIVFNGSSSKYYLDGAYVATGNPGTPVSTGQSVSVAIGADTTAATGFPFAGAISGLLVYDGELSAAVIASSTAWFD